MIKNYFTIALRNLLRHKTFSLINISGLAIGMAACLLIVLFILDELSFDQHHVNKQNIYRVEGYYLRGGTTPERSASSSFALAPLLKTVFPEIKSYVRLNIGAGPIKYKNKVYSENKICYADSSFFEVFTCQPVKGSLTTSLYEPNTAVMTEKTAQKYFGNANPIGQIIDHEGQPIKVTAVIKDMPATSHFQADMIISVKTVQNNYPKWVNDIHSGGTSHYSYIVLPDNYAPEKLQSQLKKFIKDHVYKDADAYMTLYLQPLTKIHLYSHAADELSANGDITYVYIFASVAFIILLIACINYINLTTARAVDRAKEIGLRKVTGAGKLQLVSQFLGESVFISLVSMLLAYVIAFICMPQFNRLSGKELSININDNYYLLFYLLGFSVLVGLLAGIYPAFFITSFEITRVIKGNITESRSSSLIFRKSMVVFQFSISIVLIICMLLVYSQLQFIRAKKLGLNPEQLLSIPLSTKTSKQFDLLKAELLRNSHILSISSANNDLTSGQTSWRQYDFKNNTIKDLSVATMDVDADFLNTLHAKIIAGRDFLKDDPADVTDAYILNETAVKFLNLESPVNEPLNGSVFNGNEWSLKKGKIIGVVKDFHFASLHQEIKPVIFNLQSKKTVDPSMMFLRMNSKDIPASISYLQTTWKKFEPELSFTYSFMDEDIKNLYLAEENFLQVFIYFACLAIFIACLGILGLSSYTATQRVKEIGIRKVLGASVQNIVILLTSGFIKLIFIAIIVASPIGWYLMNTWLQDYAYRIAISYQAFIIAAASALTVALITVSSQAIKAAVANPAKSLRSQ